MCWDIFMDGYYRRMQRLEDLHRLKQFAQENTWRITWDWEELMVRKGKVALVTDPSSTICFATENLFAMNGYSSIDVIGKRPSIFQGEQTSATTRRQIQTAVRQVKPFHITLVNYRKDGSMYNCEIDSYPVFNKEKKHSHFIAFEQTVPL